MLCADDVIASPSTTTMGLIIESLQFASGRPKQEDRELR
jgi:hypothetical protein